MEQKEIKNRTDVHELVCLFYEQVRADDLLGPIFEKQISMVDLFANPTVSDCSKLFVGPLSTDQDKPSETTAKRNNRHSARQRQIKRQRANRRSLRKTNTEA